jgi:tubulin polyglutamylase TTLL6/13
MYNIARKSSLSINLKKFRKEFPDQYDFFPQTWLYPSDFHELSEYVSKKNEKKKKAGD